MKLASLLLLTFSSLTAHPQAGKGKWVELDITINHGDLSNPYLAQKASTSCYICDEKGAWSGGGRYLCINNQGRDTLYYRGSAKGLGRYIVATDPGFVATVSNMSQYYPVYPGQHEIIHIDGYEDAKSRTRYMDMVVDFRYFQHPGTVPTHSANASNHPGEKTFYVFFTTSITIKPKGTYADLQSPRQLFVISVPVLHKGQLTDPLTQEKEDFLGGIDRQLEDKPEDLLRNLRGNDYHDVTVHYGKPYSTDLLKILDEAAEAVDAYKQSQRDLLQGLAQFDFFQLH